MDFAELTFFEAPKSVPARFAVVTAYEPRGLPQADVVNAAADAALKVRLTAPFRVTGRSADGWHREPGWGFAANSAEDGRCYAREFRQLAFFWVEDGTVYVLDTESNTRRRVARWDERLLL